MKLVQVLEEALLSTSNEIRDFETNAAKQIVDLKFGILENKRV